MTNWGRRQDPARVKLRLDESIHTQELASARLVGGGAVGLGQFFRAGRISANRGRSASPRFPQAAFDHGVDGDLPVAMGTRLVDSRAEMKPLPWESIRAMSRLRLR